MRQDDPVADRRKRRSRARIRFRVTLGGWLFLGVALLICAAAINSQAPLLFVLFGTMIGAMHVSAVLSRRIVSSVQLRRDLPERVWQNQTVHLGYYLSNTRRHGSALGLSVEELAPRGIECAPGYCVHLAPQTVFRAGGRFAPRFRGRIRMDQVRLSTSFPFGLVTARKRLSRPADLVIWPARGRLTTRLLHSGAVETSQAAPSPATGGQDEFFGLREYRQGDNPRWINWRRSANRPVPVVREMARPLPEVLWVILDTYCDPAHPPGAAREKMIRFAATLIDHALGRDYQVALALAYADRIEVHPPAAGQGQQCLLLDALADIDANTRHRLRQTLDHVDAAALGSAVVAVICPDASRLSGLPLATLRARCRHMTVIAGDRLERVFDDDPLAAQEGEPCR